MLIIWEIKERNPIDVRKSIDKLMVSIAKLRISFAPQKYG